MIHNDNEFFNRPLWQQYLFVVSSFLLLFVLIYYYFIADLQENTEQNQKQYHHNKAELALLQQQLIKRTTQTPFLFLSEHQLSERLMRYQLILQTFKYSATDTAIYWMITLQGEYSRFMMFIDDLSKDGYYFHMQNLAIHKSVPNKADQGLLFALTVMIEKPLTEPLSAHYALTEHAQADQSKTILVRDPFVREYQMPCHEQEQALLKQIQAWQFKGGIQTTHYQTIWLWSPNRWLMMDLKPNKPEKGNVLLPWQIASITDREIIWSAKLSDYCQQSLSWAMPFDLQ